MPARLLGSGRMQHDAAVEVEEDRHLRHHHIGSGTAAAQAKDPGFPTAVGMEKATDRGHTHGTGTKALGMQHASAVEMRGRVTLPGSEVVPGMMAQEMLRVDMGKARGPGRMHGTVRAVQGRWLWADTALVAPGKLLCDTDVAAVEQATLLFADADTDTVAELSIYIAAEDLVFVVAGQQVPVAAVVCGWLDLLRTIRTLPHNIEGWL